MSYADYLSLLYRPPLKERDAALLYLDKNEPPFSAFERVDDVLDDDDMRNLRAYPDLFPLYRKLAAFSGVAVENLLLSQGSEQAIRTVFDLFVEPGDEVVYFDPSFAMYDVYSYFQKARVTHLGFSEERTAGVETILEAVTPRTRLFSLINPHNFTGTAWHYDELEAIAEHTRQCGCIFLLDEAYYHYYCTESVTLLERFDNLLITRTFSKALGVPGIRVGYTIASRAKIELLRKLKPIDEIGSLDAAVAMKVLERADAILQRNTGQVARWKSRFAAAELPDIEYLPAEGNFILLRSYNYVRHKALFKRHNIVPKLDFDTPCLHDCIRFSVRDDATMQSIIDFLQSSR
jgi:histidinol-phosphate aminotransferase